MDFIVNEGSGFDATFEIYVKYENESFEITDYQAKISYISDGVFDVYVSCHSNINILLESANLKDLEPMLISVEDERFEERCDKMISSIYDMDKFELLTKSGDIPISRDLLNNLFKLYPLSNKTVLNYNNIAYYLYDRDLSEYAIMILEPIVKGFPNRVVFYLNLADSYKKIGMDKRALTNYKQYCKTMDNTGRKGRIPDNVKGYCL